VCVRSDVFLCRHWYQMTPHNISGDLNLPVLYAFTDYQGGKKGHYRPQEK